MPSESADLVRRAYEAYLRGDIATMLQFVDPDLEWTFLDPMVEDPAPQVCHGRHELEIALARQAKRGLRSVLEEVIGHGDRVMVVTLTPGVGAYRVGRGDDRSYDVFTLSEGRIIAMRACRDRDEAISVASAE